MGGDMQIAVSQHQGRVPVTIFTIKGDIDAQTYGTLQTQAEESLQGGARFFLLDLAEVSYISSYGIRALSQIAMWLRDDLAAKDKSPAETESRQGLLTAAHLKLCNLSPQVRKAITTTGMDLFVEICSDLDSALAAF
jgi:anti-anti-sigma factor